MMGNSTISSSEALKLMRRKDEKGMPLPFSIKYLTADRTRQTGGQWRTAENVVVAGTPTYHYGLQIVSIRPWGSTQRPKAVHVKLIFEYQEKEGRWLKVI